MESFLANFFYKIPYFCYLLARAINLRFPAETSGWGCGCVTHGGLFSSEPWDRNGDGPPLISVMAPGKHD